MASARSHLNLLVLLPAVFALQNWIAHEDALLESQPLHNHTIDAWLNQLHKQEQRISTTSLLSGSRPAICFTEREFGLGDRLRWIVRFAAYAWKTGHDLHFDWGACADKPVFNLLFQKDADYIVPGFGKLVPYADAATKTMALDTENQKSCIGPQYHIGELNGEDGDHVPTDFEAVTNLVVQSKACAKHLLRPEVVGAMAALQRGLRPEWRSMAERWVKQAASGGNKVVGVHLRLGNGEEAFQQDGRSVQLTDRDIISGLEVEITRLVNERGWGDRYKIFLATDTPRITKLWARINPSKLISREEGCFLEENVGIMEPNERQDDAHACECVQGTAWADATALGLADMLITPAWSELTLLSKVMILSRGGEWCLDANVGGEDGDYRFGTNFSCVSQAGIQKGMVWLNGAVG